MNNRNARSGHSQRPPEKVSLSSAKTEALA